MTKSEHSGWVARAVISPACGLALISNGMYSRQLWESILGK